MPTFSFASATVDFPVYGLLSTAGAAKFGAPAIQRHCDAASDEVASALATRLDPTTLVAPYPEAVVRWACELAAVTLLPLIGSTVGSTGDDGITRRAKVARDALDDIREGRMQLPWLAPDPAVAASADSPRGWYTVDGATSNDDGTGTIR